MPSPTQPPPTHPETIALHAGWHLAARAKLDLGIVTFRNVPTPFEAARAAWSLIHSPKLGAHLAASLARVLAGFLAALAAGIGLGLAMADRGSRRICCCRWRCCVRSRRWPGFRSRS